LPAKDYSLTKDEELIDWKRIRDIYQDDEYSMWGDNGIKPQDAIQGQIGNCWLVTSAMSLAENLKRIKQMFEI